MANVPADSLAQLTTIFKALPQDEQAAALQQLHESRQLRQTTTVSSLTHSCSLCEGFSLVPFDPDRKQDVASQISFREEYYRQHGKYVYTSQWRSFTKEALAQGFSRQCLLFQWIFSLLNRSLTAFKAEVGHKGSMPQREDDGHPISDLDFLDSSKGLDVRIQIWTGSDRGFLMIRYEPEPYILDNLWMNSQEIRQTATFSDFERMHRGVGRTHLTSYTTAG